MNRRNFLAGGGALAATVALARHRKALAAACQLPAGVQLYTIRGLLQRDPRAALAALREIGIVEAELYGLDTAGSSLFGLPIREFRRALDDNGIRVPISHIGGDLANVPAVADTAQKLGIETVVVARPNEWQRNGGSAAEPNVGRAQLDALAARLDRAGRDYRERGLGFGYHNHEAEFVPVDGVIPYDYLMSRTDPDLVKIELDIGWLAYAGADPVAYLERYSDRVIACHMKDYDPAITSEAPPRKLVAPGAGTIDFAAVLAAMNAGGVAHAFIEIDISDDPLAAIRAGHDHLTQLQACA